MTNDETPETPRRRVVRRKPHLATVTDLYEWRMAKLNNPYLPDKDRDRYFPPAPQRRKRTG